MTTQPTLLSPDVLDVARGLARLDPDAVRRLARDESLTLATLLVGLVSAFLAGLGGYLWGQVEYESSWEFFWKTAIVGSIFLAIFWGIAVAVTHLALRTSAPEMSPMAMVRIGAISMAPFALAFFEFIPGLNFGIGLFATAVPFALLVLLVHLAFDVPPRRAFIAAAPGFAIFALILPLLVSSDDPFGAGIFTFDWNGEALKEIYDALRGFSA